MAERRSKQVAAAEAEILRLARAVVPNVRIEGVVGRDAWSCLIVVSRDDEKRRFTNDTALLETIKAAAAKAGRAPTYLWAESQETMDRRYGGDWLQVWR